MEEEKVEGVVLASDVMVEEHLQRQVAPDQALDSPELVP